MDSTTPTGATQSRRKSAHLGAEGKFAIVMLEAVRLITSAPDLRVYIALVAHANNKTQQCYPKKETIANVAGVNYWQVPKSTKRLQAAGLIAVDVGKGPHGTNLFTVHSPTQIAQIHHETEMLKNAA